MKNRKTKKSTHPSYAHLLAPAWDNSHENALEGSSPYGGDCWTDTSAIFAPTVLSLYPKVPPCPEAVAYGVGYGTLTAFLSKSGLDRHVAAVKANPDDYYGFPEGAYASYEGGKWGYRY